MMSNPFFLHLAETIGQIAEMIVNNSSVQNEPDIGDSALQIGLKYCQVLQCTCDRLCLADEQVLFQPSKAEAEV